jgi:hypothetical protein
MTTSVSSRSITWAGSPAIRTASAPLLATLTW